MSLDLKQNYFQLFDLPISYELDLNQLATQFRGLQAEYHPDRVASGTDEQRRLAQQFTSHINTANDTLRSPRLRARYLLEMQGIVFDDERDTIDDMDFLMAQMQHREMLEQAKSAAEPLDALDDASDVIDAEYAQIQGVIAGALGTEDLSTDDLETARQAVLKLKFYERLRDEVEALQERLEDEAI